MIDSEKMQFVEDFQKKLNSTEYTIEPRANDIYYEGTTLATYLSKALSDYELQKMSLHSSNKITLMAAGVVEPPVVMTAYNAVTAAFAHAVVSDTKDVRKKLVDVENRLHQCEADKQNLEKDNADLRRIVAEQNEKLSSFLGKNGSEEGDVWSG